MHKGVVGVVIIHESSVTGFILVMIAVDPKLFQETGLEAGRNLRLMYIRGHVL